jgi:hypothetical protein
MPLSHAWLDIGLAQSKGTLSLYVLTLFWSSIVFLYRDLGIYHDLGIYQFRPRSNN